MCGRLRLSGKHSNYEIPHRHCDPNDECESNEDDGQENKKFATAQTENRQNSIDHMIPFCWIADLKHAIRQTTKSRMNSFNFVRK